MISLKPRSILQLTVTGFLSVTGLLIVALLITAKQLDGLSDQSQHIISQSATAMTATRTLIQQASAMERNARQYHVVGDGEILRVYADRRQHFARASEQLRGLALSEDLRGELSALVKNEALAFSLLTSGTSADNANPIYPELLEVAYRIADQVNEWTNRQLNAIRQEADETQALLTVQAVLLVSAALVLAGVFTALITRPLLQIEKAINHLGAGQYEMPITVSGPRDLISLGGRLDWLRSRLGKLEQQRSSFLRHVSHEFKTPLAAMQESAALLQEGVVGQLNVDQKEILRIQRNNCQRLQTLIDDLLRYNRESFSVLNAMAQPLRLDKVVEEVVAAHELTIRSQRLSVRRDLQRLEVRGDREQLRVAIDNLLTNALKFSPIGASVELGLRREDGEAVFDIQDQGPGVRREEAEKIFEPFYQGRPAGKRGFRGSGLGLAIVEEYAQANAGRVALVESEQGARFQLRLPLAGEGR